MSVLDRTVREKYFKWLFFRFWNRQVFKYKFVMTSLSSAVGRGTGNAWINVVKLLKKNILPDYCGKKLHRMQQYIVECHSYKKLRQNCKYDLSSCKTWYLSEHELCLVLYLCVTNSKVHNVTSMTLINPLVHWLIPKRWIKSYARSDWLPIRLHARPSYVGSFCVSFKYLKLQSVRRFVFLPTSLPCMLVCK